MKWNLEWKRGFMLALNQSVGFYLQIMQQIGEPLKLLEDKQ